MERWYTGKLSKVLVSKAAFTNRNVFLSSHFYLSCLLEAESDDSENDDYACAEIINSIAQA